ncbi:MAG: hypothetical protein Q9187_000372 [Circinaria calcarea]
MASSVPVSPEAMLLTQHPPQQRQRWRYPIGGQNTDQQNRQNPPLSSGVPLESIGDPVLALRPASVHSPAFTEQSSAGTLAAENVSYKQPEQTRPFGARGGSRGGANGVQRNRNGETLTRKLDRRYEGSEAHARGTTNGSPIIHGSGRQFGGRLTTPIEVGAADPSPSSSCLQADAPEFRPGQQHQQRTSSGRRGKPGSVVQRKQNIRVPRMRRGSSIKSNAPDIATRIHEDISNGVYECPICTSSGGVLAAISQKMFSHPHTPAGARKRSTPVTYPGFRHIPAVNLVGSIGCYLKNVLFKAASAGRNLRQGDAWIPITIAAGAASSYAEILCLVGNILVSDPATKDFAAHVRPGLMLVAIVERFRRPSYAMNVGKRNIARRHHLVKEAKGP